MSSMAQQRFLRFYEDELTYLNRQLGEFAAQHPDSGKKLFVDPDGSTSDPQVKRLMEGVAWLTARLQYQLDCEYPRFTSSLLDAVFPQLLCPTPSMSIVQFEPAAAQDYAASGCKIPAHSLLRTERIPGTQVACTFRTAHAVHLWPLKVAEAEYRTETEMGGLPTSLRGEARAALRLRLESICEAPLSTMNVQDLTFYLNGTRAVQGRWFEEILAHCRVVAAGNAGNQHPLWSMPAESCLQQAGLSDEEAILPPDSREFSGHRLVREYFSLPERFLFLRCTGLAEAFRACTSTQLDLYFLMDRSVSLLAQDARPSVFAMFCTPIVNLFPRQMDPIRCAPEKAEYEIIADHREDLHEVYRVESVVARTPTGERPLLPVLRSHAQIGSGPGGSYGLRRVIGDDQYRLQARDATPGGSSVYPGSRMLLMVEQSDADPVREVVVQALCTNRRVPRTIRLTRSTALQPPVAACRNTRLLLQEMTPPRSAPAGEGNDWALIRHLHLAYEALGGSEGDPSSLKELLTVYDSGVPELRREVDGLSRVELREVVREFVMQGRLVVVRGQRVEFVFDESFFGEGGPVVLGSVLNQFVRRYASINSFTETVVSSFRQTPLGAREERTRIFWPFQPGGRPTQ